MSTKYTEGAFEAQSGLPQVEPKRSESPTKGPGKAELVYMTFSGILGFREKSSLPCLIIFGGAIIGFSLARSFLLSPANLSKKLVPGEWFWFQHAPYKVSLIVHIYLSIISGIFVVFQFIPAIRRRAMPLHRLNGRLSLILLIASAVTGAIPARRAFGGELNVQASFYIMTIMTIFAAGMGIYNVKRNTRRHRKWMLRMVAYTAPPVTARLAGLAAMKIISDIGTYYAVWKCEEAAFVGGPNFNSTFPQCTTLGSESLGIAIRAVLEPGNKLGKGSAGRAATGMVLWVAMLLHILGVEIYIKMTEQANQHRKGFVLQRFDDDDSVNGDIRALDDR